MLKTLDKYLIFKYLSTFFFSILIFSLISVAIDFSDKVQSFIEKPCTIKNIVVDYYFGFLGYITGLLLPMYTLVAVVFFTSRLAFNSEILSILNAGISFNRLLRPYLMAASVVALFHLSLNHFIIPHFNKSRLWFEHTFVWTDQERGKTSNVHFLVSENVKVHVRGYNKASKSASGLRLEKFENNQIVSLLDAETASWKGDPNRWLLSNYSVRSFDGLSEKYFRSTAPLDTAINMTPDDFIFFQNQNQEMTTFELRDAMHREQLRGQASKSYEIEYHRRTADACTNIVLTIIGLAVAGRKVRGGMGLHLAVGIGIGALFILLSKFTVSFASSGTLPVALGMWIPNIIFGLIAIGLVARAQK
jgi:lipopolysaccharide export system permease protein